MRCPRCKCELWPCAPVLYGQADDPSLYLLISAPFVPPSLSLSLRPSSCSGYLWFFKIARLRLDPSAYSALRAGPEGTAIQ